MAIWYMYVFYGHLVYCFFDIFSDPLVLFPFWYAVPRKIWQRWPELCFTMFSFFKPPTDSGQNTPGQTPVDTG
jgi:hypothetical protein